MNAPVAMPKEVAVDSRINACVNARLLQDTVTLTPALIAEMRNALPDDKKVGAYFVFDSASYVHVIGNNELIAMMDDVQSRIEVLRSGLLGRLLGMDMITDAYVHPEQKVLPAKRVYVMAGDGSDGIACNIQ